MSDDDDAEEEEEEEEEEEFAEKDEWIAEKGENTCLIGWKQENQ